MKVFESILRVIFQNTFKLKSLDKISERKTTSHLWSRTHILVEELVLPVMPD